jgi:hypothetical protein
MAAQPCRREPLFMPPQPTFEPAQRAPASGGEPTFAEAAVNREIAPSDLAWAQEGSNRTEPSARRLYRPYRLVVIVNHIRLRLCRRAAEGCREWSGVAYVTARSVSLLRDNDQTAGPVTPQASRPCAALRNRSFQTANGSPAGRLGSGNRWKTRA